MNIPFSSQKKKEFSKWLLVQESVLIWINTIACIILAFVCVTNQYFGELPWVTAMCGFPWTAYGISQAFYYRKATAENTKGGIKYDTTILPGPDEDAVG
jgi:EamA domain-containing membrane protein RarD